MRPIKSRAWNGERMSYWGLENEGDQIYFLMLDGKIHTPILPNGFEIQKVIMQFTGLLDKNGLKEVYEDDIIDGQGNIIGNKHENQNLLKSKTNLLICGFGTKAWLSTYQEAMDRGCKDSE